MHFTVWQRMPKENSPIYIALPWKKMLFIFHRENCGQLIKRRLLSSGGILAESTLWLTTLLAPLPLVLLSGLS